MTEEAQLALDGEWQLWIAENLLRGEPAKDIVRELETEGLSREDAQAALEAVGRSPVFYAAHAIQVRALRAEMIVRLERTRTRALELETMETLDAELFQRRFRAANRPVLLPNFARTWPALGKWSMKWMAEHYGHVSVQAMVGRDKDPDYDRNHEVHTRETTLGSFIARIEKEPESNDFYVVARDGVMRSDAFASLHDDITPPEGFFTRSTPPATALWLGPAGTITPLHHDQSDILFTQLFGRKRVRLISPIEYAVAERARGLYGPELSSFTSDPCLRDVRVHEFVLEPGDTVFIPFGWWHHITALDPAISIAINAFEDALNPWYQPGALLKSPDAERAVDN
ncbi:MAG: cupin-like domain-containing protein [Polyangiales bacterium]